jgi:MoCo/4Fe-4S cofactor protein with predicted Tat translocation signal
MSSLNLDPKQTGKQYWKSLDELADAPEFRQYIEREFPEGASELGGGVSRRRFLQVMGAGMALAGVTGCKVIRRPEVEVLPYNKMPESLIPGVPQFYATVMNLRGEAVGLLVESHEGRPTKIEGNPRHPGSLGATSKQQQSSVLDLYNPERSQVPLKKGAASDWNAFWAEMESLFGAYKKNGGQGLRFFSGYNASPSFADVKAFVLQAFPNAKWTSYEAVNRDFQSQGIAAVTGQSLDPHYKFEAAKRILSLDADFTETESGHLAYAKAFAKGRNPDLGVEKMSRLYLIESAYSPTGGCADHRLRVKPSQITPALILIAKEFAAQGLALDADVSSLPADASAAGINPAWIKETVADLLAHKGSSLIVVGKYQPALAHALAHVLNAALGNIGATVEYKPSALPALNAADGKTMAPSSEALAELAAALDAGQVETLVVLDANPAFAAPADAALASKLGKAKHLIHLGGEVDETAALAEWHLPMNHYLEEWGDGVGYDGTAAIAQPLISPLYATVGKAEFLATLAGYPQRKSHDIVKEFWRKKAGGLDYEKVWREWLHDGIIANTAFAAAQPGSSKDGFAKLSQAYKAPKAGTVEVFFREHPNVLDGRFANNAWLQELPEPITKLTWDNAALVSPAFAKKLGIAEDILLKNETGTEMGGYKHRPMVRVTSGGRSLDIVAWVMPGLPDETVLIHVGYGRRTVGTVGQGTGFDGFALLDSSSPFIGLDAKVEKTGKDYALACTQDHWSLENRPIVREAPLEEYEQGKEEAFSEEKWNEHPGSEKPNGEQSLWGEAPEAKGGARGTYDFTQGMQWGMVVDFNSCTGCNTCIVACNSENNIPVVGKEQVTRGREMHWIRLDRYFSGDVNNPELIFQVMTCQHCENAPCEEVCPVAATTHSHEGTNDMTYNRCIGTRYCSNNCPYKVRRFNFFNYTNKWAGTTEAMQKNPDVTVRFRGVMEKCTYCIQRINRARIQYKNKGQETIPDGGVTPACAQACPSDAIVFGNINDPESRVAKLKAHPRNFGVLRDLNTKPRTTYLGRVRNPNKAIEKLA